VSYSKRNKPTPHSAAIPVDLLTRDEENEILREYARRNAGDAWFDTLEELVVSEEGFGITTATNLQRAICRCIQGLPLDDLADDPVVLEAFGGELPQDGVPPAEVDVLAAVRTAKSMIAAAVAIWASQTISLDLLADGEIPRYSILSLELDNAKVVLSHLLGALQKPRLEKLRLDTADGSKWARLIGDTGGDIVGSEFLMHPSGRPIEIRVIAGKRAGGSLVSRWSAGATLDEAPRMVGSTEGVINYEDARRAVRSRILPGAQIFSIGSPWQSFGPMYNRYQTRFGQPTEHHVVIKARGPDMNPFWWTPQRCAEIKKSDPMVYQTDVLAEFADAEETLFPSTLLNACSRDSAAPIPFQRGHDYSACFDPATRGNAWTLVISDRMGRKKRCVFATYWQGTTLEPLSPKKVLLEARPILKSYGLNWCYTDQWAADAIRDIAADLLDDEGRADPLHLIIEEWNSENKVNAFQSLAFAMANGTVEIPKDDLLHKDLKLTKKKPTQRGVTIHLTPTNDGRHCDYSPALARSMFRWLEEDQTPVPELGEPGYDKIEENRMIEIEEAEYGAGENAVWWENMEFRF